jgi:hypothetical protein
MARRRSVPAEARSLLTPGRSSGTSPIPRFARPVERAPVSGPPRPCARSRLMIHDLRIRVAGFSRAHLPLTVPPTDGTGSRRARVKGAAQGTALLREIADASFH